MERTHKQAVWISMARKRGNVIMEKIKAESGTVVLSSIIIHAVVDVEGVMKKCIVFICYKTDGTSLIMRKNVSVSSMKRNHWITSHWCMPLTNARQTHHWCQWVPTYPSISCEMRIKGLTSSHLQDLMIKGHWCTPIIVSERTCHWGMQVSRYPKGTLFYFPDKVLRSMAQDLLKCGP